MSEFVVLVIVSVCSLAGRDEKVENYSNIRCRDQQAAERANTPEIPIVFLYSWPLSVDGFTCLPAVAIRSTWRLAHAQ